MDWLSELLRNPALRIVALPLLVWIITFQLLAAAFSVPWLPIVAIVPAVLCTPQFWLAIPLTLRLGRYLRSTDPIGHESVDLELGSRALRESRKLYVARESLAKQSYRSVYLAHAIMRIFLLPARDQLALNTHEGPMDEWEHVRLRMSRTALVGICEYVMNAGTHASESQRNKSLRGLLDSVGTTTQAETLIHAAHSDGAGIYTTVNCAFLLHLVSTRSTGTRRTIHQTLERLETDFHELGWFGTRVLEACIVLTIEHRRTEDEVVAMMKPLVSTALNEILRTPAGILRDNVKWKYRDQVVSLHRAGELGEH